MTHDIFDNRILCGKCNNEMHKANILKDGFLLRAMMCKKCNEKILHPLDIENYNKFINLKNKHFSVKMRLVGNSYAVSIPKEIVSFMDGQKKTFNEFDKMVNLCFEEMGRLSLNFGNEGDKKSARIIKAKEIRRLVVRMIAKAGSGHPGGSLSATDLITVLFFSVLRYDPKNPSWPGRDRFHMSKGHCAPLWYAVLAESGYFPKEKLMTLRQLGSLLQGHPDRRTPGVEVASGSLGQGLSVALGMSLAGRIDTTGESRWLSLTFI